MIRRRPTRLKTGAKPEPAWRAVRRAAMRHERRIVRSYRDAAAEAKRIALMAMHDTLRNRNTDPRAIDDTANVIAGRVRDLFSNAFTSALTSTLQSAGKAAKTSLKRTPLRVAAVKKSFNVINPRAVAWINQHSAENITGIADATRDAIRQILADAYQKGLPNTKVITHIKAIIGLDQKAAQAVMSLADRIADNPGGKVSIGGSSVRVPEEPSDEWIADHLEDYADDLLTSRAKTIARTETIAAANEGQRQAWMEAVDDGLLDPEEVERVWIVTDDDRLCPICEDLDGETADLDGQFDSEDVGELDGPPAHPNCRCAQGLQRIKSGRAATAGMHKSSTTQVELSPVVRTQVLRMQALIPNQFVHQKHGREMLPHVTVLYGVLGTPEDVRAAVKDFGPVRMKITTPDYFENVEDGTADVVFYRIESPDLVRLREQIMAAVPHKEQMHEYEPHMTISYVELGLGRAAKELLPPLNFTVTMNMLMFRGATGASTHLFLGSAKAA